MNSWNLGSHHGIVQSAVNVLNMDLLNMEQGLKFSRCMLVLQEADHDLVLNQTLPGVLSQE